MTDGSVEIVDFKTGGVPAPKDMKAFLAPQLPMEAMIARQGGFAPVPAAECSALTYIKLAHGPNVFEPVPFRHDEGDLQAAIAAHFQRFQNFARLILFADTHPMHAQLLPVQRNFAGEFDHLARVKEWTADLSGEGGGGEVE
jgi:ATP-dependent helicase/nuclease subunit B